MNVIKESYKFTKKYNGAWITIVLLGLTTVFVGSLLPQIPALIIDRILRPALGGEAVEKKNIFSFLLDGKNSADYVGMLTVLLLLLTGLLLFRYFIGHYLRWNLSHAYGVRAEKDMRLAVFNKMLTQNSLIMDRYTSGELMSICNSDPILVKDFWSQTFSIMLDHIIQIGIAIYFLSFIGWQFLLLPLVLGIVTGIVMIFYIKDLRNCYNIIRNASIRLNSCVQENINGVRIIRSYASENIEINKFKEKNLNFKNGFINQAKVLAKYNVIFNTLNQTINLGSVILGVIMAAKGTISAGQFTTFLAYVTMISNPIMNITNQMGALQNQLICGNRMFTFLNINNIISDPAEAMVISEKPNLSMRNVSIKLSETEELKNVSVEIPYGKKIGIMGKTGSGKSVMLKAFTRLFETTYGETCINDINIKNYNVEDVRRQFGYVMQDVFLFSNTVDSNIAFYNPDAKKEEIVKAAKIAEADDFINKLTDGYNTIVGEKGLGLSGGQKQRVSIARSLLKDSPIIMLDDCTSSLDMETERKILANISANYNDRTLIIASHRVSSVLACDEIIYLEDGMILERGTHQELLNLKGRYCDVFNQQSAALSEAL